LKAELMEDNDKRIELAGDAKKIAPNNPVVLRALARYLSDAQKFEQALAEADAAVKVDAENAEGYFIRGTVLLQLKRSDDALEAFGQAIRLDPDSPTVYLIRARILAQLKHYDEAVADLNHVLESKPNDVVALLFRAQLHLKN